jgi:hypothetical protein
MTFWGYRRPPSLYSGAREQLLIFAPARLRIIRPISQLGKISELNQCRIPIFRVDMAMETQRRDHADRLHGPRRAPSGSDRFTIIISPMVAVVTNPISRPS